MNLRSFFLIAAIVGAVAPYVFFAQYMLQQGTDVSGFVSLLFANSPAAGFTTDLLITSTVFWVWSFFESKRWKIGFWWIFVVVNLLIGLSCAFPLFLYFRSGKASVSIE